MVDQNQSSEPSVEGEKAPAKTKRKYTKKTSRNVAKKSVKKASKKSAKKDAKTKGKVGRKGYGQDFKDKVLAFVKADPSRGIKAKAVKKFGVTSITLTSWLKDAGVKVDTKGGKGPKKAAKGSDKAKGTGKRGRPPGKATGPKKGPSSGDSLDTLMAAIKAKKAELSDLLKKFEVEARSL